MLLFRGGDDMKNLFEHVGVVTDTNTFDDAVTKIRTYRSSRSHKQCGAKKSTPCQLSAGN